MRGLRISASIGLLVALTATAAADRIGVIALEGKDAPVGRGELARAAVTASPDATPDALAAAVANLRAGAVAANELERFTQVRARADDGWQAFLQVQPDQAQSRLARARDDAEALLALAGGVELYADISLRLGVVLDYLGRKDDAGAAIRAALALDPGRRLSEREFSPDVLAAIDAARATTVGTRSVTITAGTAERTRVELEVDGVAVGPSPVTRDLALGTHVVVGRAPDHTPRAVAFVLDPAGSAAVALELETDPYAAAAAGGLIAGASDARAIAAVEAGLRFGEVDSVVLIATAWRRNEPAVLVQRCTGVPVRCTAITEIGYRDRSGLAPALRSAFEDVAGSAARLVAPTLVADKRLTDGRRGESCFTCKRWVWVTGGALLVAATVVTFVLIDDAPVMPNFVFTPSDVKE